VKKRSSRQGGKKIDSFARRRGGESAFYLGEGEKGKGKVGCRYYQALEGRKDIDSNTYKKKTHGKGKGGTETFSKPPGRHNAPVKGGDLFLSKGGEKETVREAFIKRRRDETTHLVRAKGEV